MSTSIKRPIAVMQIKNLGQFGLFIIFIKTIVQNLGANLTFFPTPTPTLAKVTTDVNALEAAETIAKTKAPGAKAARDIAYALVNNELHGLLAYVQLRADAAATEALAINIIEASGFMVKETGIRTKPLLSAKNGEVKGEIKLIAKSAGNRASYNWQQSNDNQLTWIDLPDTLQAKTLVVDLNSGDQLWFRVRPITPKGVGDWTDPASCTVL